MKRKNLSGKIKHTLAVLSLVSGVTVFFMGPPNACPEGNKTETGIQPDNKRQPACTWITVQDDDDSDESYWGMAGHPSHVLCKIIYLNIEPAKIRDAKLRYKIGYEPYYPKLKKHFNRPAQGVVWADVLITVNDTVVIQKSPMEIATKGWHEIPVKPETLKKGDNTIKFTWAKISEDNSTDASYGYFYMAIDTNGNARRSCSSKDYGKTFSFDTLRPDLTPDEKWQGEYMVRLEIALPSE